MSMRFYTNTRTGELMSRLNNDVIDAQRAISSTIVDIATNLITVVSTMAILIALEWRLTIPGFDGHADLLGYCTARRADIAQNRP